MADETDQEKQDIAELARNAADAVSKLAVEVGRMVMDGVRTAFDSARSAGDDESSPEAGEETALDADTPEDGPAAEE